MRILLVVPRQRQIVACSSTAVGRAARWHAAMHHGRAGSVGMLITPRLCTYRYNVMLHYWSGCASDRGTAMQQQGHACEHTVLLLALPALCLTVAAEEDIHLPVAHPSVGHWHDVLLQAGTILGGHADARKSAAKNIKLRDNWPPQGVEAARNSPLSQETPAWRRAHSLLLTARLRLNLHAPLTGLAWGQQCMGALVQVTVCSQRAFAVDTRAFSVTPAPPTRQKH